MPTDGPVPPPSPNSPPNTPVELLALVERTFGVRLPMQAMQPGSTPPGWYIIHTFFEGLFTTAAHTDPGGGPSRAGRPTDCVLWANRGGGKTFLGALATMLDLLYKPGIEVRILAGSLEQASRMLEHLRSLSRNVEIGTKFTARRLVLENGSRVEVLAASETSVRGTRVQKLRCDEVDLFKPEIWRAAQLVTRLAPIAGPWGPRVLGTVEALSTMHVPMGLMWDITTEATLAGPPLTPAPASLDPDSSDPAHTHAEPADRPRSRPRSTPGRTLFRWGVLDVLARCEAEADCAACQLLEECAGRAKRQTQVGHVPAVDAESHKVRIPLAQWQSEGLCLRPSRSDSVFPEFDERTHVYGTTSRQSWDHAPGQLVAGMDFGFRSPTTIVWAKLADDGILRIIDCYAEPGLTLTQHIANLRARGPLPTFLAVDPAGAQRSAHSGLSSIAVLRQAGLVVPHRPEQIACGLSRIRAMLEPRGPGSSPTLLIHRSCGKLIEAMQRYHYPHDRPHDINPVKDGQDHIIDALRYLINNISRAVLPARASRYLA